MDVQLYSKGPMDKCTMEDFTHKPLGKGETYVFRTTRRGEALRDGNGSGSGRVDEKSDPKKNMFG
jgi:hypothetical protein